MKFISTRLSAPILNFEDVIFQGLATDGGLYIPEFLPSFDEKKLKELRKMSYQELFFEITRIFIDNEIPAGEGLKVMIVNEHIIFKNEPYTIKDYDEKSGYSEQHSIGSGKARKVR
jgi:threonine synthase